MREGRGVEGRGGSKRGMMISKWGWDGEREGGGREKKKGKGCQLFSSSSTDGQISFLHFLPLCAVCLFDRPPPPLHHHRPFLLFLLPSLHPPCAAHVQQVNLCRNHSNSGRRYRSWTRPLFFFASLAWFGPHL